MGRILFFDGHSITITTVTSEGKEFESFDIQEISSLEQGFVFLCLSRNEENITIVILHQKEIEVIDLYRRSSETEEEVHVRFHMDKFSTFFDSLKIFVSINFITLNPAVGK